MKPSCFLFLILTVLFHPISAQDVYKLWEGQEKPYYKENSLQEYEEEAWGTMNLRKVTEPTLTIFPAQGENSGKSVILVPGGGYEVVAINHEGYDLAKLLAAQGITAGVLKYRIPDTLSSTHPHLVPLSDARQALKLFRSKSQTYNFDKAGVGLLGFSAGSHLATVASLWKSEDPDENPAYSALIYGVTNIREGNTAWLEGSLYFRKMTPEEVAQNTLLNLVNKDTPPAFLVHAYNDPMCHVTESTLYAEKLFEHGVPTEMHLFPAGGHGFGIGKEEDGTRQWVDLFVNWLKALNLK